MADPNHPRRFTDDFKRQIVDLYIGGKPVGEIMVDYDLGARPCGGRSTPSTRPDRPGRPTAESRSSGA